MNKNVLLLLLTLFVVGSGISQVAINQDAKDPHPSAMLDIRTTEMGLLIPRMNFSQMYNIDRPATGLLVFNTSANTFYYYDGGNWTNLTAEVDSTLEYISIKESLNIKPKEKAPLRPKEGELYMDAKTHTLRCFDGKEWKNLW